jgi:hypothetical protein
MVVVVSRMRTVDVEQEGGILMSGAAFGVARYDAIAFSEICLYILRDFQEGCLFPLYEAIYQTELFFLLLNASLLGSLVSELLLAVRVGNGGMRDFKWILVILSLAKQYVKAK